MHSAADLAIDLAKRIKELETALHAYRNLYLCFGADDMTDAKFAQAYEKVRLWDKVKL